MAQVRRVVTTRAGGTSAPPYDTFNLSSRVGDDPAAVGANRARLAASIGLTPDRLVWMRQVHGTEVHVIDQPPAVTGLPAGSRPAGAGSDGDGVVTATRGLGLATLAADCVPILLAEPDAGVVGAAHAGRRGAAAGIATATLQAMTGLGADPGRIDVLLGPAACGRCYEVPAAMRDEVEAALPGSATTTRQGTPALDLRAGLARQLRAAGAGTVVVDPACTMEDERFFSHRRDGVTGRFAGVVWLP